ncbi:MAG: PilZ domain-containing protein, partial [Bacteriovoracia bacterium]
PLIIMALIYFLAPVGNAVISARLEKLPLSIYLTLLFKTHSPFELFQLIVLFPLAGFALFAVKKWSVPVFLGVSVWSLIGNYQEYAQFPHVYTKSILFLAFAVNLAFVFYFLIPAVRAAYLDPRLRWWESKPRYRVNLEGKITVDGKESEAKIVDISEGGVFIQTSEPLTLDAIVQMMFKFESAEFSHAARIAHQGYGNYKGFGIQFMNMKWADRRQLRRIVKAIDLTGAERRPERVKWHQDFALWIKTLFTTGKGLVPVIPETAKKAKK